MKIAVMQPYLFPYIGYFQLINSVDKFVVYDDVNYIVRGWVNRNRILVNDQPKYFTLPLDKASRNKNISDIRVSKEFPIWKYKFLKTLELNYKKAPFYGHVHSLVDSSLSVDSNKLVEILNNTLNAVVEYLEIDTIIVHSSSVYTNNYLRSSTRILDICTREKASHYVNLIGGQDLYSEEEFEKQGVLLSFIKCNEISYKQRGSVFHPLMSIIDMLMFNSKARVQDFLEEYTLTQ